MVAQSFTYDVLNRILTAQSSATSGQSCWGESFALDPWANLTGRAVTKCSAESLSAASTAANQGTGQSYDAAGNLLTGSYAYDGENRIISAPGVSFDYDAEGLLSRATMVHAQPKSPVCA